MNIDDRLYVEVVPQQGEQASSQLDPLKEGRFDPGYIYKVLGMYAPSATSEAYFALANLQGQISFVPQHSVRAYGLINSDKMFLKMPSREKMPQAVPGMAGQLAGRLSGGVRLSAGLH